jgi:cell division septum initiation protein DivIVA
VDIDRQAIERRDFPITRRGYEPAAVDAHLRALAAEVEQLQRERPGGGSEPSLASTAGSQVQSILAAAEAAAADIERQALDSARTTREDSDSDAARTREEAIEQARAQVAAVAQATAVLLERVGSMDGEVSALVERLRAGAGRLADDLAAVETNMGELYDAAAGRAGPPISTRAVAGESAQPAVPLPPPPSRTPSTPPTPRAAPDVGKPPLSPSEQTAPDVHVDPDAPRPGGGPGVDSAASTADNGDLDGARLIALNMALNGESRAETDRYLAENFQLADRLKLIDEVYAAIEG